MRVQLQLQVYIACSCPYPCPCSPTVIHTDATTHSLFLSLTPSFLPSLFLDLCRLITPSQRHLTLRNPLSQAGEREDLTVFVPSFGIPGDRFEFSHSLADPKLRLLLVIPFFLQLKVDNHNPATWIWARISSLACARPYTCKIIPPTHSSAQFPHDAPSQQNSHYFSTSEASRIPTSNVPR